MYNSQLIPYTDVSGTYTISADIYNIVIEEGIFGIMYNAPDMANLDFVLFK